MSFKPPIGLRNSHVNTIVASTATRRWWLSRRAEAVCGVLQEEILECADGVRLYGEYLPNPRPEQGLVILLHGWEGCSGSGYMLSAARRLYNAGFSVYNLHLRDHGPSEHLNADPFLAIRLTEILDAIEVIQAQHAYGRYQLVGFSLGGNIAVRVAANMAARAITLEQVVAICPPADPAASGKAISDSPIYNRHFVANWRSSFARKLQHFPELKAHADVFKLNDMLELHEAFVPRFSNHPNAASYFRAYRLGSENLQVLAVPCHVIMAKDDPVIPVQGADVLPDIAGLSVEFTDYGGHCGFLKNYSLSSWVDDRLLQLCASSTIK
jgi:predicted alpha/beta-fold hydrolase